jgi:hypothetical protein
MKIGLNLNLFLNLEPSGIKIKKKIKSKTPSGAAVLGTPSKESYFDGYHITP